MAAGSGSSLAAKGSMVRCQYPEVSDSFWKSVEPLIPLSERDSGKVYARATGAGRKPLPSRQIFEAIVYVLRRQCAWRVLPKARFGSPSAVHAHYRRWLQAGFFTALWQSGLAEHQEMEGIAWHWRESSGAGARPAASRMSSEGDPAVSGAEGLMVSQGRIWGPVLPCRCRMSRRNLG